ncbi:5049_t:CDS:2 [Funneliformis geosporum]|uniref:13603_t:CDS:1 n=1 Tax=Funneliformis geosporum TaxID=1117311 RepID=A0A9W4SEV5_9GLOM|nr:5049_t:CDS:2 [Funneliformis geosporum]CAI2166381.1 13603_t:CDS:2 [Funneliformis geosporum]
MHRAWAFKVYGKTLNSALKLCKDEDVKGRLLRMNKNFDSEIQKDWELEEVEIYEDKDEDDKGEADKNEDIKDDVNKDENDKDDEDFKFIERHELDTIGHTRRWILSSGIDVEQILSSYRCLIPESQNCVNPIYWEILNLTGTHPEIKQLFSAEDWNEMLKSFENKIETIEKDIPDVVYLFFDEIEQIIKNNGKSEDIIMEIDGISSQ